MKKIALLTTLGLMALTSNASAQIDVGTYSVRTLPTTQLPAPIAPVHPAGR